MMTSSTEEIEYRNNFTKSTDKSKDSDPTRTNGRVSYTFDFPNQGTYIAFLIFMVYTLVEDLLTQGHSTLEMS